MNDVIRQLKQLALDQGKPVQAICREAGNRIFMENNLPGTVDAAGNYM